MLDGIQIDPVAFTIPIGGGFPIYWYGILVTLGIAIGVWWGAREIAKRNQNVDEFFNGLILVIFSGYLFARLTYVTLEAFAGRGDQFETFLDLINIRSGGINILGGFIGAAFVGWLFIRWRGLNFWQYADVAGPAVLIAQAIGRWGNFINQEVYGKPTDLPWAITIQPPYRLPEYWDVEKYHPLFLYESLWNFANMALLLWLGKKYPDRLKEGDLFLTYLVGYPIGRFFLEFLRLDSPVIGTINTNQTIMLIVAIVAAGLLFWRHRPKQTPQNTPPAEDAAA